MHRNKRYGFTVFLAIICCNEGLAQIFGGNPSSIQWQQINTPLSRIIFPKGLDSTAERITNIIAFTNGPMQNTIGKKSKKINLVLQNQTIISNAYVGLSPYRSEFFITPDQNSFELGSLPWPDQLTIHEFRHVQQYNNFDVGLSKVLHDIFGDDGQSIANSATIPNWFFEGDAVYNETNLSKQGRGSLPLFYNGYRSIWKEGKNYDWLKLRNGSFKDFVPDHYKLGFMLVAYGREKYGDIFWGKVTHDAACFKGFFYPFQKAVKKYSGVDYVTFRNDAFNFFKQQFSLENISQKKQPKQAVYADEEYPAYVGNDSIVYVKSSYRQLPEFIIRSGKNEKKIRIRDYSIDNQFSYKSGKIVYASYRPDARWGYRDYSDLRILDITNGKEQTLTNHTKYFSPGISNDGKKIVAVNVLPSEQCNLYVLDATNGKAISEVPNPDHLFYTYPRFYDDDKIITAVRNTFGKMSLAVVSIKDGSVNYLLPFSYNVIGFPFLQKDTVYFSYSYQKNDELFAYTFADKKLWRINSMQDGMGKYQPSANDESIVWSTFTAEGYKLQEIEKSKAAFKEVKEDDLDKNTSAFGITSLQKTNANLLYAVPDDSFIVTKYPNAFRLFNFHSIQPQSNDPEYSLSLLGENVLNTFQSQLSFTYNRAEQFKRISFTGTYSQLFPYLSAGVNYTLDRRTFYHGNQVYFNELEPFAGFSIPLNFSKGRSFAFLNFGSQYVFNQTSFQNTYKDTLGKISYSYSSSFLSFSHQIQKTIQQIFPRFAQSIRITYKAPLTHYKGFQFAVNTRFYLPGFFLNHSLVLNGAYLKQDTLGQINFSSGFPFSRGYSSINLHQMYKWGVDYHLPLMYPDAGFASIVYLLRVRGDLYFDDTRVNDFYTNGNKFNARFRSAGTEIYFDTKWWNQANVSIGIRYSRLFDKDAFDGSGRNRFEIILPVNIFNQ